MRSSDYLPRGYEPKMLILCIALMILAAPLKAHAAQIQDATLHVGGAEIEVSFEAGELSPTRAATLEWISESACAVTEYYGHFPVRQLHVVIVPLDHGKGVVFGRTFVPDPVPVIRVMIGRVAISLGFARGLDHDPRNGASGIPVGASGSITGSRKELRRMSRPSHARKSATLPRRKYGAIWLKACRTACPRRAIAASTIPIRGDEPTGAARCSASSRMSRFIGVRRINSAFRMRSAPSPGRAACSMTGP